MASRADYPRLRKRSELASPGIYILLGPSESDLREHIYIGEADDLVKRLDQHQAGKDFGSAARIDVTYPCSRPVRLTEN